MKKTALPGWVRDHDTKFLKRIRRFFKKARSSVFLLVLAFIFGRLNLAFAASQPNIIFLLTDDMGYGDVACYGGNFVPTPNIDEMAKEGTKFTQFYVAAPVCSPSRVGYLTGMFPARWRITNYLQTREGNRQSEQADFLDPSAPSYARQLKAAGYTTGHFGKWHMGGGRDVTNAPLFSAYGFDEHNSTWESPQPDPEITATNWIWSPFDHVKRYERTQYFVDKTLSFLDRHRDKPCFVDLWPDDVHTPWVPTKGDMGLRRRRFYQSMNNFKQVLAQYDVQVGRLFAGLKRLGLDSNTIVIFASDNGPIPTFGSTRTAGLRGAKDSLYEGGTREPFIVRWPGHVPAGRVDNKTVICGVDMLPMLCHLGGASLPEGKNLDGEDMSKAFFGNYVKRDKEIFWEYGRNETPAFGYPRETPLERSPNVAVRDGKWKLLVNADGTDVQLYNIDKDQDETTNVADKNPRITKRLKEEALKWRRSVPGPIESTARSDDDADPAPDS
ncbi:MAG TPA: sulfatase-like hydrolase/transferase [Verrucomicrobiae bacterium]|jgi:arylsulfatase A-like enzyme|nr:sulfatase-like hydrolase/transferase [Verrucomicrobiae bacterium]